MTKSNKKYFAQISWGDTNSSYASSDFHKDRLTRKELKTLVEKFKQILAKQDQPDKKEWMCRDGISYIENGKKTEINSEWKPVKQDKPVEDKYKRQLWKSWHSKEEKFNIPTQTTKHLDTESGIKSWENEHNQNMDKDSSGVLPNKKNKANGFPNKDNLSWTPTTINVHLKHLDKPEDFKTMNDINIYLANHKLKHLDKYKYTREEFFKKYGNDMPYHLRVELLTKQSKELNKWELNLK